MALSSTGLRYGSGRPATTAVTHPRCTPRSQARRDTFRIALDTVPALTVCCSSWPASGCVPAHDWKPGEPEVEGFVAADQQASVKWFQQADEQQQQQQEQQEHTPHCVQTVVYTTEQGWTCGTHAVALSDSGASSSSDSSSSSNTSSSPISSRRRRRRLQQAPAAAATPSSNKYSSTINHTSQHSSSSARDTPVQDQQTDLPHISKPRAQATTMPVTQTPAPPSAKPDGTDSPDATEQHQAQASCDPESSPHVPVPGIASSLHSSEETTLQPLGAAGDRAHQPEQRLCDQQSTMLWHRTQKPVTGPSWFDKQVFSLRVAERLVKRMQNVPAEKLTALRWYLTRRKTMPVKPTKEALPMGAYRCDDDGLLKCQCQLPIIERHKRGRAYYRCADRKTMKCCYLSQKDFDSLPQADREAGTKSLMVWREGSKDKKKWVDELRKSRKLQKLPNTKSNRYPESEQQYFKELGAWSETYLYLWLEQALPEFGPNDWVSSIKRYALFPDRDGRSWSDVSWDETPYDFEYKDKLGSLGPTNQVYFIEAKSTTGVVIHTKGSDCQPQTIRISHRGWKVAEQASAGSQSTYAIIYLDRVDAEWIDHGCPRLATVLVDPCALAHPGLSQHPQSTYSNMDGKQMQTSKTSSSTEVTNYPILTDVQTTGEMQTPQDNADQLAVFYDIVGDPAAYRHYLTEKEESRVVAGYPDFKCRREVTKKLWLNHWRLTDEQKQELQDPVSEGKVSAAKPARDYVAIMEDIVENPSTYHHYLAYKQAARVKPEYPDFECLLDSKKVLWLNNSRLNDEQRQQLQQLADGGDVPAAPPKLHMSGAATHSPIQEGNTAAAAATVVNSGV